MKFTADEVREKAYSYSLKGDMRTAEMLEYCAAAIDDAEGDGGGVGGKYTDAQVAHAYDVFRANLSRDFGYQPSFKAMRTAIDSLQTHPARSGVVSDADTNRLDWLATHPCVSTEMRIEGELGGCVFWGIACVEDMNFREAIDAAIQGQRHD